MKLKMVGFYKELVHGDKNASSLKKAISIVPDLEEEKIIGYLKNGLVFIACPGVVYDVINTNKDIIGSPNILTDGVWAWPQDLEYYVRQYHAKLPIDFVQHMRENKWRVSKESINIDELQI